MDIDELKDFLWCFCHPLAPQQRCVDPKVYEGATSTKDILKNLCPEYVNPVKLFGLCVYLCVYDIMRTIVLIIH